MSLMMWTLLLCPHCTQVDKLNHIISEADAERFRQQREYDIVINERDILGTQLIRECALPDLLDRKEANR